MLFLEHMWRANASLQIYTMNRYRFGSPSLSRYVRLELVHCGSCTGDGSDECPGVDIHHIRLMDG